ncbi:MAG: hypothetical protein KKA07_13310 [Bacteroidetes bacterium]|nr:hypothetical protein [Bacteroidota bacterium]MBU1720038.1 hypothetical protein [Bacteroidota bacterium]
MKKNIHIILVCGVGFLSAVFSSCSKYTAYTPENPPPPVMLPSTVDLKMITPPPLLIKENAFKTISRPVSQYFQIAIPPCVDMTGKSDNIRSSLADKFYTALFETKRFSLLDRSEQSVIQASMDDNTRVVTKKDTATVSKKDNVAIELENLKYQDVLERLKSNTDGLMQSYITSDKKSLDGSAGVLGIDFRIVNKHDVILFGGFKELRYSYDKKSGSLEFNQADVNELAKSIQEKFPNPDIQDNLKIINRRGNIITVNAGKTDNIFPGMFGYVIKKDVDPDGNVLISYRALFEVKEVFMDNFNAVLIPDSEVDISTVSIGEPIKMK